MGENLQRKYIYAQLCTEKYCVFGVNDLFNGILCIFTIIIRNMYFWQTDIENYIKFSFSNIQKFI